jgi:hypothetical protein
MTCFVCKNEYHTRNYRLPLICNSCKLITLTAERDEYRDKATAVAEQNLRLMAERDRYRDALAAGKRWADLHRQWGNTPLSVDPLDNLYPTEANEAMFDFVELCRALDGEA